MLCALIPEGGWKVVTKMKQALDGPSITDDPILIANPDLAIHPQSKPLAIIKLIRVKQWIKNAFVFAPLLFTSEFRDLSSVARSTVAFAVFCLAASAVYVLNDIKDVERDRRHPRKSITRPLANGSLSIRIAFVVLSVLLSMVVVSALVAPKVVLVVAGYVALNVAYSLYLKHQPVVDIFTIAIGFVLRIFAGAVALDVPVSSWMAITTLCLALYLAAIKRRQELSQAGVDGRDVLSKYSVELVDRFAEMSATGALIFYSMFVFDAHPELAFSIPVVLFGLFRYWYSVEALDAGESPTDALLADWQLISAVVIWIGICGYSLWSI